MPRYQKSEILPFATPRPPQVVIPNPPRRIRDLLSPIRAPAPSLHPCHLAGGVAKRTRRSGRGISFPLRLLTLWRLRIPEVEAWVGGWQGVLRDVEPRRWILHGEAFPRREWREITSQERQWFETPQQRTGRKQCHGVLSDRLENCDQLGSNDTDESDFGWRDGLAMDRRRSNRPNFPNGFFYPRIYKFPFR